MLPIWLRLQAMVWPIILVSQAMAALPMPWAFLPAVIAVSFLTLCTLLRAVRTAADVVTIVRMAGLLAVGYSVPSDVPLAAWSSLLALVLLDLVDGALARRFGGTAEGAILDMEADQFTVLLLALLIVRGGGPSFVLLAPGIRYVFVLAMWAARLPAHDPKPVNGDNRRGRLCCAFVVTALLAALFPGMPATAVGLLSAAAVAVLVWSFSSDARFLLSRLRPSRAAR
ncbi:MAG: CDP-alcohol phosphatidyltransferase family protein [Planctomycetes bacterium]|nr:CDP-alcohol phosphatidyltransferase family protein [Planctomycetota bacterium]